MLEQFKALPRQIAAVLGAVAVIAIVALGINLQQYNSHRSAEAAWEQERLGLNERIGALEADVASLRADVDQKASTIGELEATNASLTSAYGTLQAVEAEAAAAKSKLLGLTTQLDQSESQLKIVGHRLATNQASLMTVISRREQAAKDAEALKANQARLTALRTQMHAQERQLQLIGQRLAVAQVSLRKALNRRDAVVSETERLAAKSASLAPLAEQAELQSRKLKSLARRVAASQKSLTETLNRRRQAREALGLLEAKSRYLTEVVAESEAKERRLKDLALRLAATQAGLKRSLDQRQQVVAESQTMLNKLAGIERKLTSLGQELGSWGNRVQDLRDLVGEAESQLREPLIN